jgi:predicted nucleic acid-binding protein
MGYLIDSNVIIDFCNGKLTSGARNLLQNISPEISIITQIELFGTKNIVREEIELLEKFTAITTVHPVSIDFVPATIQIRQSAGIKLPDAIIAATAVVLGLVLVSRNISDFKKVVGLHVIDPYVL